MRGIIECQIGTVKCQSGLAPATVLTMSISEVSATKADFVRSQAIQATRSLLAVHGLTLTMDQIADGSGVSRRSLFRYFESRDELVRVAIEAAIDDYEQQLASFAVGDGPLDDWLVRVIEHTHRSHLAAGRAVWQLTSAAADELSPELREVDERRRAMRRRVTAQLTERAWHSAGGAGSPPDEVAEAVAMSMSSYTTQSLVVDLGQSVDAVARLSASIIGVVIESNLRR
jgi:AcrR family transcriptional regulator